ncbi:gamma-glutamyltransferase family protein [Phytoactinopolyspora alkaliphila]|nr:gamma-glutamyltransferase [Phytoactinopolyspora alkaliphila]
MTHVAQGRGAAAAAEDPRVLDAVRITLERGGNAVDAAVAAAAVQGVCRPMSGGLGGGGFMLIRLPSGRSVVIEHREQASAAFGPESMVGAGGQVLPDGERRVHGHAVGVPGAPRAWAEAIRLYGRLGLAEVLAPAIALADAGFEVDETLHREIAERRADFAMFEPTARIYLDEAGTALPVGAVLTNPDLARTYETFAADGVNVFYDGKIADAIVAAVNEPPVATSYRGDAARPGAMTRADLSGYTARHLEPVRYRYGEYELVGPPLPSSGALTIAEALGILDRVPPADGGDLVGHIHRYLEACRLAFADRSAYLGDGRIVDVPAAALTSDAYLRSRAAAVDVGRAGAGEADASWTGGVSSIDDVTSAAGTEPGDLTAAGASWMLHEPESPSTIHLSVDDGHGMTVSYTSTIVSMGGCGIVVPGTGILLNDALAGRAPGRGGRHGAGRPMPGMRPLSSMAPTMVQRGGRLRMTVGSPGGTTIITTVLQLLHLTLGAGMGLAEALAHPRVTQRGADGGVAEAEPGFLASPLAGALEELGHRFIPWTPMEGIGAANGLQWNDKGDVTAVAEPVRRGSGYAAVWRL